MLVFMAYESDDNIIAIPTDKARAYQRHPAYRGYQRLAKIITAKLSVESEPDKQPYDWQTEYYDQGLEQTERDLGDPEGIYDP